MRRKAYGAALVLGLGRSGMAAARLLRREGAPVVVVDRQDTPGLRRAASILESQGARVLLGTTDLGPGLDDMLKKAEGNGVCVVSPGIRADSEWVKTAAAAGLEVIGELELGARRCQCGMLAITGSKGKSTAAKLCGESLALGGQRVEIVGNYGVPLCEVAERTAALDWVVVEASSFQLETVRDFRPRVGVLLNIQADHLDRHGDLRSYAEIKMRLFRRMGTGDVAVLPIEIMTDWERSRGDAAGKEAFERVSFGAAPEADFQLMGSHILRGNRLGSGVPEEAVVDLDGTRFENRVLGLAAAAVTAAVTACGVLARHVAAAARAFEPLPHRMENVGEIRGVRFVDDSKGTSLSALRAALEMTPGSVRLIAGGRLKEHELESVKEMLEKKVSTLYLIGDAAVEMKAAWQESVTCRLCGRLEKAVQLAFEEAGVGETVLLSPGCASFDQFRDFEDRGEQFVNIVRRLQEEEA